MAKAKGLASVQASFGGVFTALHGVTQYESQKYLFSPHILLRKIYSLLMKDHCVMSWKSYLSLPNQSFGQNKMGPHRIHLSFMQEPPEVFVG